MLYSYHTHCCSPSIPTRLWHLSPTTQTFSTPRFDRTAHELLILNNHPPFPIIHTNIIHYPSTSSANRITLAYQTDPVTSAKSTATLYAIATSQPCPPHPPPYPSDPKTLVRSKDQRANTYFIHRALILLSTFSRDRRALCTHMADTGVACLSLSSGVGKWRGRGGKAFGEGGGGGGGGVGGGGGGG